MSSRACACLRLPVTSTTLDLWVCPNPNFPSSSEALSLCREYANKDVHYDKGSTPEEAVPVGADDSVNVPSVLGALRMSGKPILVEPQGEARLLHAAARSLVVQITCRAARWSCCLVPACTNRKLTEGIGIEDK